MTKFNWLRYKHYRFWHRIFKLFPIYRDAVKEANRWCFIEMQVQSIQAPRTTIPGWTVRYMACDQVCVETGHTLIEALEHAMAHAEIAERNQSLCVQG